MAHEIKNPLVTIKTFTELLPTRYEDPDFRETFFSLVGGEVRRIDTIVNQLLRFARPSKPMLAPTRLHEVLDNALKLLGQQFRNRNIRVVQAFEAPHDDVSADADQLSQALINMMLNAADSMPNGGTLTVTTRAVGAAGQQPAGLEITIRDTGEGIRPENLAHVFDPFFTTKSQGTGLGLSVAHGIVQDHGGSIDVESEVGRGTVFRIVLPSRAGGGGAA
jgi:signal transduction histidine kinase